LQGEGKHWTFGPFIRHPLGLTCPGRSTLSAPQKPAVLAIIPQASAAHRIFS
jgi:hypothetical protein